jgi:hypothetical protein
LGGVEWIHLAQDRDRWRAVVSAVMNLRVLAPPTSELTACSGVLEKLKALAYQPSKVRPFMHPKYFTLCSQQPATVLYS